MDAKQLRDVLKRADYPTSKTDYLYEGFSKGFSLKYCGNLRRVKRLDPNLKIRVGSQLEL